MDTNFLFKHPGIWSRIAWRIEHRRIDEIRVFKVKARQDVTGAVTMENWKAHANHMVDAEAKRVFECEEKDLFQKMGKNRFRTTTDC